MAPVGVCAPAGASSLIDAMQQEIPVSILNDAPKAESSMEATTKAAPQSAAKSAAKAASKTAAKDTAPAAGFFVEIGPKLPRKADQS